jgi:pimeloyl-ACP methyl ester carboxylesterase
MAAPTEREIEANGLSFETLLAGPADGEAVILLHGYPQSAGSWRETMEWLAGRGFRAIAPNLRGYSPGASPSEASEYSMDKLVADVIGIADSQKAERFHLVGHDWGGALAWSVAGTHPKRLLSLTVLSTPHSAAMLEAMRNSTQGLRSSYMAFFRLPRIPEMMLNFAGLRSAGLGLRVTGLPAESWHRDRAQLRRVGGLHGPLNWYRGAINRNTKLRRVSVPTMYIWGKHDFALGRRAAERTAKYVTGPYRFEEINAGHWIVDRNADVFQRLLGEHLDDFSEPKPAPERQPRAELTGTPAPAKAAAKRAPAKAAAKRAPAKRPKAPAKPTPPPPEAS